MSTTTILYVITLLSIPLLVLAYKKREEDESRLGWKIAGYYLLGSFTLNLNDLALPLGFLLFLLFFRPVKNRATKQNAAYLGLVLFLSQLIVPAIEEYIYERPREIAASSSHPFQVDFNEDWAMIQKKFEVNSDARLDDFRAEYQKNGQLEELSYDIVARSENGFVLYDVVYSPEKNRYTVRRRNVGDQWLQYERSVLASRFFEVVDDVQNRALSQQQSSQATILIDSDGQLVSYGIRHRDKYRIDDDDIQPIADDSLPVTGYTISTCERIDMSDSTTGVTRSRGCIHPVDYVFDAM